MLDLQSKTFGIGCLFTLGLPIFLLFMLNEVIHRMAYQSRKRDYRTPREKNAVTWRNTKLIVLFFTLAIIVWVFKNRYEYWAWIKTYFY